jgi:hypothetical protein
MKKFVFGPAFYCTLILFCMLAAATPSLSSDLGANLSLVAGSDGSSKASGSSYSHIRDGNSSTYWQPRASYDERISIKWSEKKTFNTIVLRELTDVVSSWQLVNYNTGEVLTSGDSIGSELTVNLEDVSMKKISLIIVGASSPPKIAEMEIYNTGSGADDSSDASNNDTGDSGDTGDNDDSSNEDDSDTGSSTSAADGDIVLSPNGSTTLQEAIDTIEPGNTIYLKAGTYKFSKTLKIVEGNNGTSSKYKKIAAQGNATPVLDFSALSVGSQNRGIVLAGDYWQISGIKIQKAGDNGMLLAGSHNIIKDCEFYANNDTGLQISRFNSSHNKISQWPSYNVVKDCYSHSNADPDDHEDADGFAAKLTCGKGNKFIGCVAKYNVDDGWDLYTKAKHGKIGAVYFEDCEASNNGVTEDGERSDNSDGNGFKLGGSGISVDHKLVKCKAYDNHKHGFTNNSNPGDITLINCKASGNGGEDFKNLENISK